MAFKKINGVNGVNQVEGIVLECLENSAFRIILVNKHGQRIIAHLSRKLRESSIDLSVGDRIIIEMKTSSISLKISTYRYPRELWNKIKRRDRIREGIVIQCLGGELFRVLLYQGDIILANLLESLRQNSIEISLGDRVQIEIHRYDLTIGSILWRIPSKDSKNENG